MLHVRDANSFLQSWLTSICPSFSEQPLFFCEELHNQEAEEGETAFLCCELSKPGVDVQWKKGAIRLRPGNKYEMKQDGCKAQLQIHDLTCQDSGTYKCCSGNLVTTASVVVKGESRDIRGSPSDFLYF